MFENFRKLLRHNDESIPLPPGFDSSVFNHVISRAISSEQQTKVLRTTYHLSQLWQGSKTSEITEIIVMVDATYPHLERMADLEIFGDNWLAELATVVKITMGSADNLVGQSEQFKQLLKDAMENVKPG